jgi:hypothetical protein
VLADCRSASSDVRDLLNICSVRQAREGGGGLVHCGGDLSVKCALFMCKVFVDMAGQWHSASVPCDQRPLPSGVSSGLSCLSQFDALDCGPLNAPLDESLCIQHEHAAQLAAYRNTVSKIAPSCTQRNTQTRKDGPLHSLHKIARSSQRRGQTAHIRRADAAAAAAVIASAARCASPQERAPRHAASAAPPAPCSSP